MRSSTPLDIFPIILAAGKSPGLGFPKPLARFGNKSALQIAIENCSGRGLRTPIVVFGHQAGKLRAAVPRGACIVVNRRWRGGQLESLRAGLQQVPRHASFMLYPVDLPLLTAAVIRRLVTGFKNKLKRHTIVVPRFRHRMGHPVIFSSEMRHELATAQTAKEVVYRDKRRVKFVRVATPAIAQDFHSPSSYRQCLRDYRRNVRKSDPRARRPSDTSRALPSREKTGGRFLSS